MSSIPLLETQNLGRKFGQLQVLSGFDLTVEAGEILGIIGPNGAGKSTLLSV
ncbi:MAG: ATP-binding cassette domain-containing protein, partial [Actinobacteria bacterium]|nr:ATP-binding cassette domain-containing protein [Actinomycetota bacterium]